MNTRQQMEIVCTCTCRLNELYSDWAKQHGMSYNTMMTLYALSRTQGVTQKQITVDWLIPKQTVNTVVKELERQGHVRFSAGKDQKEKLVSFTAQGKQAAQDCLRDLYALEERVMESLGPELRQALVESNRAFTEAFAREVRHGA